MSDEQFRKHAEYPRHYQAKGDNADNESVEQEPSATAHDPLRRLPPACLLVSQIDSLIEICCLVI